MSKSNIRKISVDPTKCNTDSRRPSVFERLGTKPVATGAQQITSDYCRNWALNGNCSYGKTCKYANTHTLISPSKRVKKDTTNASAPVTKEDPFKRVTSKIVKKTSHSPDLNLEEWNQTDLEYEDEKVLERRRQLLQRELELQMKKDKEVHTKDRAKHKKKMITSSSSSHSSSSSSSSTSSSSEDSSSSSSSSSRKKLKKIRQKRGHSPASDYDDDKDRKKKLKLKRLTKTDKIPKKKRKLETPPSKKDKEVTKSVKKTVIPRKHSAVPSKSPTSSAKSKESLNRSESPLKSKREPPKDHPKRLLREFSEPRDYQKDPKSKPERPKELEKPKVRLEDKSTSQVKLKSKSKERRSRTPPKVQKSPLLLKRRSRTPEKRQKRESPRPKPSSTPSRLASTPSKAKDREMHKPDRPKDRDDFKKLDSLKPRLLPEDPRKLLPRAIDDKRRLKDHRDERKPHDPREDKLHSRREKDREDRLREDRPRDLKDIKPAPLPLLDKRYLRDVVKEKPRDLPQKDDKLSRDRRTDRERERNPQKFEKYDKERFRGSPEKVNLEREIYDRNRHRRFPRFDERKEKEFPPKIERRDSPRGLEVDRNFERNYPRGNEWDNSEEGHFHEEEPRRKNPEGRRFNSPFAGRNREERPDARRFPERNFEDHYPEREKIRTNLERREEGSDKWEVEHNRGYVGGEWEDREWNSSRPRPGPRVDRVDRVDRDWERESAPRSEVHDEEWGQRFSPMSDWKMNESTNRKWESPQVHRGNFRNERLKEIEIDMHGKRRSYGTPEGEGGSHGSKQSSLHGSMKEEPINKKLMELAEGRPRRSREKSVDSFGKKLKDKPALVAAVAEIKETPEAKRLCLDESVAHHTESDFSDISDDPDDILNMEDEENDKKLLLEMVEKEKEKEAEKEDKEKEKEKESEKEVEEKEEKEKDMEKENVGTPQAPHESPEHLPEEILPKDEEEKEDIEEDNMETMDFEEISDGELEEDIKTSGKGLGDALGVDWESLVKESQPRRHAQESGEGRWECRAIFQRIGISRKYAGDELTDKLCKKYGNGEEFLLNDIAMIHAAMWREKVMGSREDEEEEEESEDEEVLKPFVGLFEEAKRLLEGEC